MILVGIYARVSTEEQAKHGFSISAQIRECRQLAAGQEAALFADEGVSGEILDRPALGRLREQIRQGQISTVICLDPDRLSRKLLHQLIISAEWEEQGIELRFVNGDYAKTPEGTLFYALRGAISEFEKAKITERMCRGRREKAKQGRVLRDFKIYGYDFEPNREKLVINEGEALIVKQIFDWFINPTPGIRGISGIARTLSAMKVPTKRGAPQWHRQVIRQILSNRTYLGEFFQNKWDATGRRVRLRPEAEWILIPCPSIIAPTVFSEAQYRLNQSRRRFAGTESDFLLSGLLRCAVCQCPLRGKTSPAKDIYLEGALGCGLSLERKPLEAAVWQWFWERMQRASPVGLVSPPEQSPVRRELLRIMIREIKVHRSELEVITF